MKHLSIRISRLKELITLEEKRDALQKQIATINERLSTIQDELYGTGSDVVTIAAPTAKAAAKTQSSAKRKGRGELKGQIIELLQAAGKTGSSVKELANRIGVKTVNVHSWFSANLNKLSGLKKVGAARYALNGAEAVPAKPAKKAKVKAKAPKAKKAKAPKAEKAVKAPKIAKHAKAEKVKAVRGQLKDQILSELKNAGDAGITIKDLAAKLNANYKNVYIWFVTTGKKIAEIKKVGPAQYKLEAA